MKHILILCLLSYNIIIAQNNPPVLIAPANGATQLELTPTLDWSDISGFSYYNIQISTNSTFDNKILDSNITFGSLMKIPELILDGNKSYYWRVRVKLSGELSPFSNSFSFKTKIALPRSWAYKANTGKSSIVYVHKSIQPKIGNRNIVAGDVIGLFYSSDNNEFCAGYGTWTGNNLSIKVWGDDILTSNKDGFANNEIYKYKMWDSQEDRVYNAVAGYASGPDNFQSSTTSVLNSLKSSEKNINIVLNSGWNMISSNVNPINKPIDSIFTNINPLLAIAKNNAGNTYIPEYDINEIGDWDYKQGYQIYMTKDTVLSITGTLLNPENEIIPLTQGWNMVSYLRSSELDASTVLETITYNKNLIIAKNNDGNVYIPEYGINTIGNLLAGQGYLMYLNSNAELIYPAENLGKIKTNNYYQNYSSQLLNFSPENKEKNMTVIVEFENSNNLTEVAVFDKDSNICGSSRIIDNKAVITIWNNKNWLENEQLYIKALNLNNVLIDLHFGKIYDLLKNIQFEKLYYKNNSLLIGKITDKIISNNLNLVCKPNPLKAETVIEFDLLKESNIELCLYDLTGNLLKPIINKKMNKGHNNMILNMSELPYGNYFLILTNGDLRISKKISLIK